MNAKKLQYIITVQSEQLCQINLPPKLQGPWIDWFIDTANEYPYLWALYAFVIVSPFVICAAFCVKSKVYVYTVLCDTDLCQEARYMCTLCCVILICVKSKVYVYTVLCDTDLCQEQGIRAHCAV